MIVGKRLHENQLPLNNILPTNKIEGEVSLRKLRPPYFYNFNRALELSQRIFTLVPVIASRRIGVIPSTIATSIRIVRIGNHHLGDAHIAQHLTKSFPPEKTEYVYGQCYWPKRQPPYQHSSLQKKGGTIRNHLNEQSFHRLFLPT